MRERERERERDRAWKKKAKAGSHGYMSVCEWKLRKVTIGYECVFMRQ